FGMKTHASPCPGGQSPAHIGGWPGCETSRHGMVVVVVLCVLVVWVVLVVVVVSFFNTGAQKSFGPPMKTPASGPNWSRRFTLVTFLANLVSVVQSTVVPAASVHSLKPIL